MLTLLDDTDLPKARRSCVIAAFVGIFVSHTEIDPSNINLFGLTISTSLQSLKIALCIIQAYLVGHLLVQRQISYITREYARAEDELRFYRAKSPVELKDESQVRGSTHAALSTTFRDFENVYTSARERALLKFTEEKRWGFIRDVFVPASLSALAIASLLASEYWDQLMAVAR